MAYPGYFTMGIVLVLVGISVILLRRLLGRYAYRQGLALGSARMARTPEYWMGVSWLVGGGWCLIGVIMALASW